MKLLTWNVRGLGSRQAKDKVQSLLETEMPDMFFFSETKIKDSDFNPFRRSCGYSGCITYPPRGSAGGLALCWKSHLRISLLSYSPSHIDVVIDEDGDGKKWRFTGFYGQPDVSRRHESWDLLRVLKSKSSLPWLCMGDYNEILWAYEKQGGPTRNATQMLRFQEAIDDCELNDIGYSGLWYTWKYGRRAHNHVRERLDRGLANADWCEFITDFTLQHLVNSKSDHSPLLLLTGVANVPLASTKSPLLRFEAAWILDDECEAVVRRVWESTDGDVLVKLTVTLEELSRWGAEKFKKHKRNKRRLQKKLEELARLNPTDEVLDETDMVTTLLNQEFDEEHVRWAHHSNIHWLVNGDKNTEYFFRSAKGRKRAYMIRKLVSPTGDVVTSTDGMMKLAVDYFSDLFTSSNPSDMDTILQHVQCKVTPTMNVSLSHDYTNEEIKTTVFSMSPTKASGPDGLPALFYQRFWSIVGSEVTAFCLSFLNGDADLSVINATNIVLLPKVTGPSSMKQFRPISLSNILYKIVGKTLANRFKGVLNKCIDPGQSAFIPGRLITDNVLIAYELLHTLKTKRSGLKGSFALKTDMSKAYDRVEWPFLEAMMTKLGFEARFVKIIMRCIKTVSYSVLINGARSVSFSPNRGIRQGDPLSTYLFLICSEGLSTLLQRAQESGALYIRDILYEYGRCSGQEVNFDKSLLFFSSNTHIGYRNQVKAVLCVRVESNPEKYLGLPSMIGRDKNASFAYLKSRLHSCIKHWTTRYLSQGGKEIFIKSVLQALTSYAMSCFLLPKGLCNEMNALISRYWWKGDDLTRGMHWARWSLLCTPKNKGGLGFRDLAAFNVAMLSKQGWRLATNPSSLVAQVLGAKYYSDGTFLTAKLGAAPSLTWRGIWSARGLLEQGICFRVGSGYSINPWTDRWVPSNDSYKVQMKQGAIGSVSSAADFIDHHAMEWKIDKLHEFMESSDVAKILCIPLPSSPCPDVMAWRFENTGMFSVKSAYMVKIGAHRLQQPSIKPPDEVQRQRFYKFLWGFEIPPKIQHTIWRIFKNYVAIKGNLFYRHIAPNPLCPRCNQDNETGLHAFRDCTSFNSIWTHLGISENGFFAANTVQDWLYFISEMLSKEKIQKIMVAIWANWSNRNKQVFDDVLTTDNQFWRFVHNYQVDLELAYSHRPKASISHERVRWIPPDGDNLKINVDACFDAPRNHGASGVVIRNADGALMSACSITSLNVASSFAAEATAVLHGLQLALVMEYPKVILESDSLSVICYLNSNGGSLSPIAAIINSCKQLIGKFKAISFQFVRREGNSCAHTLAEARRGFVEDRFWVEDVPDCILPILCNERPL